MLDISSIIAAELEVKPEQVKAAIKLLDEGATVPFIARYRKESTQSLTDVHLRTLHVRLQYLRELEERKQVIIESIKSSNNLTSTLESQIINASTKARLEDLYKPFKPKRRTKAQVAIEAGLNPLAHKLLKQQDLIPQEIATQFINPEKDILTIKDALEGARYILMEHFAFDADLVGKLRTKFWQHGILISKVKEDKQVTGNKFKDYFDFQESLSKMPSHRTLAVLRGRNEGVLSVNLQADYPFEADIAKQFSIEDTNTEAYAWLRDVVHWSWQVKLKTQLEAELITTLREQADAQAIDVFAHNLKDLLMTAPAGAHITMGLDPGIRTGVKIAIIDATSKVVAHTTVYPHPPKNQWQQAITTLAELCKQHFVSLISIGNGTASRETEQMVQELMQAHPLLKLKKIVVSEAGASVYSASQISSLELKELDVSLRGAVSIARRLQDPLAELVKIEPKSIGVGQYQHDVNQLRLAQALDGIVEDCVNKVGVDLNTASVALLERVSGLNKQLAENIIAYRNQNGAFRNRQQLLEVSRLGAKTFEQAAGFLRILNGDNPLDSSSVHPEAYPLVQTILDKLNQQLIQIINSNALDNLKPADYISSTYGMPTVLDTITELKKPGRDPRPEFKTAQFDPKVNSLNDLQIDMILEGVITNVANFGAFVDVGVHQDGLVHVSHISNSFVKSPRDVVKAGDIVKVKVIEIDKERKRINLSMLVNNKDSSKKQLKTNVKPLKAKEPKAGAAKPLPKKKSVNNSVSVLGEALKSALANTND